MSAKASRGPVRAGGVGLHLFGPSIRPGGPSRNVFNNYVLKISQNKLNPVQLAINSKKNTMIDTTLNISRIHCNLESDFAGAEPYLWTVFFYSDFNTFKGSAGLVVTHTPHQTSTTRNMYPNGVEAGDDIVVPLSMGEFDVTLENGGLGLSLAGCLFVLIDERNTDSDAIKAGHVAFGASAHEALNDLAAAKVLVEDKTPTPDEVRAMATQIGDRVKAAIKEELSWWDYLDQQDRFIGSGFKVYSDAQISEMADGGGGADSFVVKIRAERNVPDHQPGFPKPPQPPAAQILIDDYDVFGTLRVRQSDPVPDPSDREKERFDEAVRVLQDVRGKVAELEGKIADAEGEARDELVAELRHIRKFTLKAALRAVGRTGTAYDPPGPAPSVLRCIEPDCCFEHARQVYLDCFERGGGMLYCKALSDYRLELCKNPNAQRPPVPPTFPAARD